MQCIEKLDEWLSGYLNFERLPQKNIFWLDTMQFLCGKFSHPERAVPCIHVGGSKGKGSTSAMIASALEAAGYRTGIYTSPHILSIAERAAGPYGLFAESVYQAATEELMGTMATIGPQEFPGGRPVTWFELVTLWGMLCFRHARVDFAVYEVGLGGRLDATNVITPLCSCIGPIELEHTEYLGNTLEQIAREKAGIIKPGVPVIVAAQKTQSVRDVFRDVAAQNGSPISFVDERSDLSEVVYKIIHSEFKDETEAGGATEPSKRLGGVHKSIQVDGASSVSPDGQSSVYSEPVHKNIQTDGASSVSTAEQGSAHSESVYKNVLPNGSQSKKNKVPPEHAAQTPPVTASSAPRQATERSVGLDAAAHIPTERSVVSANGAVLATDRSVGQPGGCPDVRMCVTIRSPLFARPLTPCLAMLGAVQAQNAALAALAVKTAVPAIREDALEQGLSRARLAARFQVLPAAGGVPFVVLDGAHTVNSVRNTVRTLRHVMSLALPGASAFSLLYASAADKDVEDIAALFAGQGISPVAPVTLTTPGTAKQSDMPRLCAAFSAAGIPHVALQDTAQALSHALSQAAATRTPLLVTGSFYLAAEATRLLAPGK